MISPRLVSFQNHSDCIKDPITNIGLSCNRRRLYEDIEDACKNKRAFLFMNEDGFFVLKPYVRDGLIIVQVWVAYSKIGNAMTKYQSAIEECAKDIGAAQLEFYTARKGYERLAPRHGWQKAFTVWTKDL